MSEEQRDLDELDAGGDQETGRRVAQVVKSHPRNLRLSGFQDRVESSQNVPRVQAGPDLSMLALLLMEVVGG